MMKFRITSDAKEVLSQLGEFPQGMRERIAKAMDRRNELTASYVQKVKLTNANPPYLNVRSGRLRRSVRRNAAKVTATRVVGSFGTNVGYAGVHEHGFVGTVQVGSFTRKASFGREGTETVRAHSRKMKFKARHMFEHGLDENAAHYTADITAAVLEAWGA